MDFKNIFLEHIKWVKSKGVSGKKLEVQSLNFGCIKMKNADINCLLIVESNLDGSILTNNDMSDCYFLSSSFNHANISNSMISKSIFNYGSFKNAKIRNCLAIKASFEETNLTSCDFLESDLRRVSFRNANLKDTKFNKSNISECDFTGAYFHNTNIEGAIGLNNIYAKHIYVETDTGINKLNGGEVSKWFKDKFSIDSSSF